IGDWSRLPAESREAIQYAIDTTADNTGLQFNIALNYGGRAEILRAARLLAEDIAAGRLNAEDAAEEMISERLYTAGMPDPELIIRTGGEQRLSNFLTWQSAYSELVVSPVYWPDFSPEEYDKAIVEYQSRDRRFGGVKA
ncbi:MAG: di-trans,poly-cis-decaprenylcistransferase, partial [Firmicutes bacterium]|nr:di-trans,poly-cis-decaprenylcistransferase [Bacillota bacterium]